jgi:hypothetical protein
MPLNVADMRANVAETIRHAAQVIGRSKQRRALFAAIYHGKKAVKTVPELAETTGLSEKRVLEEGRKLAANQLVEQEKVDGRVAYKKDGAISPHKHKILDLVDNPGKKDRYPTKQEPRVSGQAIVHRVSVSRSNPQPQEITIDEIEAFAAVKGAAAAATDTADLKTLREDEIKRFLHLIIGEMNESKDWGGEKNDIYTSRLQFRGARRTAAFALKGRATQGPLTPKKMGKNGDQVGRLMNSEASVFFVVYHGEVREAIHEQMRAHGLGRAVAGNRVYYCVADGQDLARLARSYPDEFAAATS